jgi:predicted tellurium resistance membrane protein TerC
MDWISNPDIWIGLLTLTALEIVLGIDNIIFISILAGKLPEAQQAKARQVGLGLALVTRILLLLSLSWIIGLTAPLFSLPLPFLEEDMRNISGRDLVLLVGGLFLIGKSTMEIHDKLEGVEHHEKDVKVASFTSVIVQILLLDVVFSLDSVITAVGMVDEIGVMIAAVVIAIVIMLVSAGTISDFVNKHPTVKMLALSFLLLIGMSLVAEGLDQHIPKGYIYFAMGFSALVEVLNLQAKKTMAKPVQLRQTYVATEETPDQH